jgi:KUP system potassium uptake protein
MGIVFGDIGTSPLYTLQVAVKAASPGGAISPEAVLGIVSLIFWSLIVVISIKYAGLIMRANNHGEGGILARLALISPQNAKRGGWRAVMVVVGLIGATLLYGDGTITPAISVLSAVEGIKLPADRDGAVAQSYFCAHASQCTATRRLLQYSKRPGDGDRGEFEI